MTTSTGKGPTVLREQSGKHSAARWLAFMWGIGAILMGFGMLFWGTVDHLVIGELLAASLTALGLRKRSP